MKQFRGLIFAKGHPVEMDWFVVRNSLILSIVSVVSSVILIRILQFFEVDLSSAIYFVTLAIVAIVFGGLKSHGFSFINAGLIAMGILGVISGADNVFAHVGMRTLTLISGFWFVVRYYSEGPATTPSDKIAPRR